MALQATSSPCRHPESPTCICPWDWIFNDDIPAWNDAEDEHMTELICRCPACQRFLAKKVRVYQLEDYGGERDGWTYLHRGDAEPFTWDYPDIKVVAVWRSRWELSQMMRLDPDG